MTASSKMPTNTFTNNCRTVTVHIPVSFRQRAGRKQILTPSGSAPWSPAARVDTALLKAVVRAYRCREILEGGRYSCAADLAHSEKVNPSYLNRLLPFPLTPPHTLPPI